MCINKSNFFTSSHPVWERRGSLTLLALPAFPGRRGPGSSEVRRALRGAPTLRAAPRAPAPAPSPAAAPGLGLGLAWGSRPPRTRGFGPVYFPTRLLFTWGFLGFFLRHLWSTWRFISLGDYLLSPNEARDLSRIPQIKLAWPWLHPVWISHLPNDFMSRTQRVNFLLTFPIAAVSILL